MPQVPTYNNFQTTPGNLPGVRLDAPQALDTAGTQARQLGQGMMQAGDAVGRIALDVANQVNQVRLDDAMTKAQASMLDLTHGAAGYKKLIGDQALTRPDGKSLDIEYSEKLKEQLDNIGGSLGNDAQRQAFAHESSGLLRGFQGQVSGHMADQFRVYNQQTQDGKIAVARDSAAINYQDPAAVAQSRGVTIDAVDKKWVGAPEEYRTAQAIDALSSLHSSVLQAAIQNHDLEYAKTYLGQFGKEMTPDDRKTMGAALKIGDQRVQVQSFADDVMAKKLPMTDAITLARTKFSGDLEDEAVKEVKARFSDNEAAQLVAAKQVKNEAWASVMSSGSLPPPTLLSRLRQTAPEEERQMRDYLDAKAKRAREDANGSFKTDMGVWYGLRQMAIDEPQRFAILDLKKSEPYLSKQDFMGLANLQASIGKGDAKAMQLQNLIKSTVSSISQDVKAAKIDLGSRDPAKAEAASQFMAALTQRLDQEIEARKADNKPAPTYEEMRRIGLGLVNEGIVQGSGIFGLLQTKKRGYQFVTDPEMKDKSLILKGFDDIPAGVRDSLLQEVGVRKNAYGKYPDLTDEKKAEVERMYTRGVQKGKI